MAVRQAPRGGGIALRPVQLRLQLRAVRAGGATIGLKARSGSDDVQEVESKKRPRDSTNFEHRDR